MQTLKVPRRVNIEEVIHVACGGSHTIFIAVSGKAYSTGLNNSGQVGLMHVSLKTLTKVQSTFAACGEEFSFIITYDKEVYGMRLNNVGQLGISSTDFSYSPIPLLITSLTGKEIESISCGKAGAIGINEEGEGYNGV
jgi:alpha-tubulin suppressor-like RCC1 family protein